VRSTSQEKPASPLPSTLITRIPSSRFSERLSVDRVEDELDQQKCAEDKEGSRVRV